ncbi:histidine kinase CKI1 [Mercurialis annua]|uniref:histidine kinase CKI1 n=1 Tax=Mercurialis annua TaxID=3986 RepID=UPI00215FB18C|nr:histidine kinase CKI1 [Mercurialis annua]
MACFKSAIVLTLVISCRFLTSIRIAMYSNVALFLYNVCFPAFSCTLPANLYTQLEIWVWMLWCGYEREKKGRKTIGVLLLPSIVIPWWYQIIQHMKNKVDLNAHRFRSGLLSEIDNTAKLLAPINSSATNLARILSSSLNGSDLSQFEIENKVAPILFQTFSVVPHISQISYLGLQGSVFAYYRDGNEIYAVYSNSSTGLNLLINCTCYKQFVDHDTGKLQGDTSKSAVNILANSSWIEQALTSPNGYASIGNGWNSAQDVLFLNSVGLLGQGVISLGFPLKALINFFNAIDIHGGSLYLATLNGDVIADGLPNTRIIVAGKSVSFSLMNLNGDHIGYTDSASCIPHNGMLRPTTLNIEEAKFTAYCSQLEIMGVPSVYAILFPYGGLVSTVNKSTRLALILLTVMIAAVFISVVSFILLMMRAASREIHLCSSLIKQMEATQQAERKSMNKSLAFASASHDIRAALAGITGLIEISYDQDSRYELQTNLRMMDDCAKDLVGLLNSILDTSKIEAGKMQVESEEFDLANMLEDVVDLFHPVGMKKGVDIVLDLCDGSAFKFSCVKGDRGKLKQVLYNLLSNAVKFTSEGHVSVRAWVRKRNLENEIIASSQEGLWNHCCCWFMEHKQDNNDVENKNSIKQNPNCMEFVFEVDDTGVGIPKDEQKSVFENFVQVKETALGQGGTGLGLGIVQSLVRLMGGEIGIVDKENRERGTCFRFNTFLITSEVHSANDTRSDIEMGKDFVTNSPQLTVRVSTPSLTSCSNSPRLSKLGSTPKINGSLVVILIQNTERLRIVQKFVEGLGIKALAVTKWQHLSSMLTKIKSKQTVSPYSSSGKSDYGSRNDMSGSKSKKGIPLSTLDGTEQKTAYHRSSSILKGSPSFTLLVIDTSSGPFEELCRAVSEYKAGFSSSCCKVVWLDKPISGSINRYGLEGSMIDSDDEVLHKPLHGSRLHQVLRFLPEFGGNLCHEVSPSIHHRRKGVKDHGSSSSVNLQHKEISGNSPQERNMARTEKQNSNKPLNGLRFLVAEDSIQVRRVAEKQLSRLGASVMVCEDGDKAVELVRRGLQDQRKHGVPPYDCILMDCEMPGMNGYEATRAIRLEERSYDIRMLIIAFSADDDKKDEYEESGMDGHLSKVLKIDELLKAIGKKASD